MNSIERYLGRVVVGHTLLVLMVLLLILGFSEFMIQLGKINADYTLQKGVLYTLLKLPVYGYEIFPVAILIGTLLGLGSLANHAELTILRVTGWSIGRIFWGVMKSVFLLWLVAAVIGEIWAPQAESYAKKLRGEALHSSFSIGSSADIWLKDEQKYIHIERVINEKLFHHVTLYHIQNQQLVERIYAEKASYDEASGQWKLFPILDKKLQWQALPAENLESMAFAEPPKQLNLVVEQKPFEMVSLPVTPALLETLQVETRYMGIVDLYGYIDFLQANALDAEPYKLAFWRKLATPLVILGMIALVFPLIFGSQRQVSMGQRIFVGIMIGMSFHLLNQIFGNLTVVYHLPTLAGAMLPSLVFMSIAFWMLKRVR
ncbi:LPS export ABC transporter permease LptG [Thiosulfativibrio zosterae]|uniref:LPS export ABC transporter permease LptG n=1 Tax=Thiosulfativibrio zosterae TaxID=2675053 RepID=A0A6F8PLA8_9GAMM|nr:LPS export ABC transporter permease LptG [Thiosulfativibrio zosterae]BBP42780.1 LPS export ABC transporter permease LptG [Thiosulfativibrio zosterae]